MNTNTITIKENERLGVKDFYFNKINLGYAVKDEGGFYVFRFSDDKGALWSNWTLKAIADTLTELNREWNNHINTELNKDKGIVVDNTPRFNSASKYRMSRWSDEDRKKAINYLQSLSNPKEFTHKDMLNFLKWTNDNYEQSSYNSEQTFIKKGSKDWVNFLTYEQLLSLYLSPLNK